MLRCWKRLPVLFLLAGSACSSQDPTSLLGTPSRGPGRTTAATGARDAGEARSPGAGTPSPPSAPPGIATDASAGGTPANPPAQGADAGPAPTTPPAGSCANPKCGATTDGCGCAAKTDQGELVYVGCNDQGCVCGRGQTTDPGFTQTGACDSDSSMRAAFSLCACP